MQSTETPCKCPYCGANTLKHWHRISKGLAQTLIEFKKAVIKHNRNQIHIKDDMNLTKSQFNNFQKLRYHGLVAKYIHPNTKEHIGGYWLLTRRGNLFCKNAIEIPVKVQTYRNKISDKTEEKIYILDVLSYDELPYWDERADYLHYAEISDMEESDFNSQEQTQQNQ